MLGLGELDRPGFDRPVLMAFAAYRGDSRGQPEPVIFDADGYDGVEPTTIVFPGDGNSIAAGISWSTWSSDVAIGHGTAHRDTCVPNCAQGMVTPVAATITLSDPGGGTPTVWQSMTGQSNGLTTTYSYPGSWAVGASGGHLPTPSGG